MRKLLRNTLADCLRAYKSRKYEVNVNNYHFEIVVKDKYASLDIYLDYGFGGDHMYELVKKNATGDEKPNLEMDFFAERILKIIETYPGEHPLDRDKLYEKYQSKMEKEYRNLVSLAHGFNDEKDLYDLLKDEKSCETYIFLKPQNDYAHNMLCECFNIGLDLNYEHLHRLGIVMPDEGYDDISSFLDEHKDKCIFGDALVDYCYSLDTEEHPIPWLLYMTFNGDRKYMWDYSFKERYARVLNYLAVKENRTIFNSLTPESVEALRKEKKSITFHSTTDDYTEDIDSHYYQPHQYSISIPDNQDFEDIRSNILKELIKEKLI